MDLKDYFLILREGNTGIRGFEISDFKFEMRLTYRSLAN